MKVGDSVGNFALPDQTGTVHQLTKLAAGGFAVVFVYPAALTAGCTAESCHFRDLVAEFREQDATVVGISGDPVERQLEFAQRNRLAFPLLSDADGTVRRQFGIAPWRHRFRLGRKTFIIDSKLRIVGVVAANINMAAHADQALKIVSGNTLNTDR